MQKPLQKPVKNCYKKTTILEKLQVHANSYHCIYASTFRKQKQQNGAKLLQPSEEIHIICLLDEQTDVIHDNNKKLGFFIQNKYLD